MISRELDQIFNKAVKKANELHHEYLTLETILFALMSDDKVKEVIESCGGNPNKLEIDLDSFLSTKDNFSILSDHQIDQLSKAQFASEEMKKFSEDSGIRYQPEISMALQRVIQRAALHVQSSGKKFIAGVNVLVSMFSEKESHAIYLLGEQGIDRLKVVEYISHGMDKPLTEEDEEINPLNPPGTEKAEKKSALEEFCVNLNKRALDGKIDPIIGRKEEIQRAIQILARRRKNNPLLVGESGVGKTAIGEGLALAIVEGKVPPFLENTTIFRLDLATLLAGTKFRGDFEERLKGIVKELSKKNESEDKAVLYIDEIHTIIGAGSTSNGSMDASNLLKPALASGELRCMGSTTFNEFRKYFEKDQALSRRFQKIEVLEPSLDETIKIVEGLAKAFEKHHGVKYSSNVIKTAVKLSDKFISEKKNPDKSIDVIDEAGAFVQLLPANKNGTKRENVTVKDIEQIVSQIAKVPKVTVHSTEKDKLKNLERDLKLLIFGQDQAIEQVNDAILLSRSGLNNPNGPIANFLFAGPTGVGKTELAKQLANIMGVSFKRFDMSEYMEKHAVSKLIGAPPGYVGFDQGGLLTDAISQTPYCILLLDEIEKAHPDIYNILLQVMDHGALTDSNGRVTDFRNTVIIMTTNAGAKEMESGSIGFGSGDIRENTNKRDKTIKNFFTPEFRNRLNAIIHFNKLGTDQVGMIVDKFLLQLEEQLKEKNVQIEVSSEAKEWLGREGYDEKLGARPILRVVDEKIKKILAKEVLFGELSKGGLVKITLKNNNLNFDYVGK